MKWYARLHLRMFEPEVIRKGLAPSGVSLESNQEISSGVRLYFRFAVARAEGLGRRK